MYQIDNSSAAAVIPASTPAGTPGYFTDGNPATGIAPTILPAEFMNMVMLEILGVLSAAGVTPSKSNFTQLASAIRSVNRQAVILTDTGTAGAYAAANTPALTALPTTGHAQWVNIAHANPGSATYSPDGLPPKPIYGLGLQPLQGGELPVGVAVFRYLVQSGVNGGNGAWIVTESFGGAAQFAAGTASGHAALVGQLQSGGPSFALDTGTANSYVCAFTPAITSRSEGQPLRFKVKTANNGACTINDGLGVVPLVGGAHSALQGGELVANGDAWIQWNTSIGGGSYILLLCTGAAEQVANATQSQHALTLGQVQQNYAWNHQMVVVSATGNFTVPAGVYFLDVEVWSGGGAGGGVGTVSQTAGGGGGGGYARSVLAVTPGQVIACTVGAGGVAVSGSAGGNGGASSFGAFISITGGGGGQPNPTGSGGGGGVPTGGTISMVGGGGGAGIGTTNGGSGGGSPFGGVGGQGGTTGPGANTGPGAGGGGRGGGATGAGGNGSPGQINIKY